MIWIQPINKAIMVGQPTPFKVGPLPLNGQPIEWHFGDGVIGKGEEPSHVFKKPIGYRVRMITRLNGRPTAGARSRSISRKSSTS